MRIVGIEFGPSLGIGRAVLPWASTMVFFGPNDAGKSGILGGVGRAFGLDPGPIPFCLTHGEADMYRFDVPDTVGDSLATRLTVELDGLEMLGHPDQDLLCDWWWTYLQDVRDSWVSNDPSSWREHVFYPLTEIMDALPAADSPDYTVAVAAFIEACRQYARAHEVILAGFTEGPSRSDYELILDTCLASRKFRFACTEGRAWWVEWLAPSECELTPAARSALQRLRERATELDIPMPFAEQFPEGSQDRRKSFMEFDFFDHDGAGFGVSPCLLSGRDHDDFYQALEHFIGHSASSRRLSKPSSPSTAGLADEEARRFTLEDALKMELGPANPDSWLERHGDAVSLRPEVVGACEVLAERANALAPAFVSDTYRIRILPLLPDYWPTLGRRVIVRLELVRDAGVEFDLSVASAGIGTWVTITVSEAMRVLREEAASTSKRGPSTPPAIDVFFLDEPELHLHPLAQEQAAEWVAERSKAGATMWIATHSLPFLRLPLEDVEYFKVSRAGAWETTIQPITNDVVGAIRDSADELGLPPVALIQLTRAWLIVEGEHDRKVIYAFYGAELRRCGIRILALRGAARAKASFLNLDALAPLGLPFFVVLDNARAAEIASGSAVDGQTEEEKIAHQLGRLADQEGLQLEVRGLPYPDIMCALPFEAVQTVATERSGHPGAALSWQELVARHQHLTRCPANNGPVPGFKPFVLRQLGLEGLDLDTFITEALRACSNQPADGDPLGRIIREITARVDPREPIGT